MPGQATDLGHHLHQGLHVLQDRALQLRERQAASATGRHCPRGGEWRTGLLKRSLLVKHMAMSRTENHFGWERKTYP